MSVGTDGQYLFQFSLGEDYDDFVNEEELKYFTLIEEAGNVLPTFELGFNTLDDKVFELLHEGSELKVTFGKDRNSLLDAALKPARFRTAPLGQGKRSVTIVGLYSALGYLNNSEVFLSAKKSGIEVIRDIAKEYFKVEGNVTKSRDSQIWIQPNQSAKKFVDDIWLHSDLADSFPAIAISSDGKFIVKDIKSDLKNPYKWRFVKNGAESNDLDYDADFVVDTNTGLINSWVGYGREQLIYNMETNQDSVVMENTSPVVSLTSNFAQSDDVIKKFSSSALLTENMHENYHVSQAHNLASLAAFSNTKIYLSFHNSFVPIRVLDQVMFMDSDIGSGRRRASEFNSGIYYVSRVARSIESRQFTTIVELCRESLNSLK